MFATVAGKLRPRAAAGVKGSLRRYKATATPASHQVTAAATTLESPRVNPTLVVPEPTLVMPDPVLMPPQHAGGTPCVRSDMLVDMRQRHFLSLKDFSKQEVLQLLATASALKNWYRTRPAAEAATFAPLAGESIGMIFQKRSTRTRVSTEMGMRHLGGHALYLGDRDIQLGQNETLEDTARVLSRFNSIILARVFEHSDVETLSENSSVPVINALSDKYHPLQTLADLLTLQETFGNSMLSGKTLAWVGDGNNVLHSLMIGSPHVGMNVRVATPSGYEPIEEAMELADKSAEANGVEPVFYTTDPLEAVNGADVIVTDTWVSMGQEAEFQRRLQDFAGYQVTHQMARDGGANPGWRFLHCLPRKEYEVDDAVFLDAERSLVWEAAENRQWTVMAVMLHVLRGGENSAEFFPPTPAAM